MTHQEAEMIVKKLNLEYISPEKNCVAFCAKRSCQTDSNGFWEYYISSPSGVISLETGLSLSFVDQSKAINDAIKTMNL